MTRPTMNPIGCPAPSEANAIVLTRPGGNAAPKIPVPAGARMAGASPRSAIRMVNSREFRAKETAMDSTANRNVPVKKRAFLPRVSARPPARSRNVPLTRLQEEIYQHGLSIQVLSGRRTTHANIHAGHWSAPSCMPSCRPIVGKATVKTPLMNVPRRVTPEMEEMIKTVCRWLRVGGGGGMGG